MCLIERTTTKHRATGFDPEWLKMPQFKSWLYNTQHGKFNIFIDKTMSCFLFSL